MCSLAQNAACPRINEAGCMCACWSDGVATVWMKGSACARARACVRACVCVHAWVRLWARTVRSYGLTGGESDDCVSGWYV